MTKKLFGFIDKRPLIWFHYLPLVAFVILGYYITNWLGIMSIIASNSVLGWFYAIVVYYFVLLIGDNFIHTYILGGVD